MKKNSQNDQIGKKKREEAEGKCEQDENNRKKPIIPRKKVLTKREGFGKLRIHREARGRPEKLF